MATIITIDSVIEKTIDEVWSFWTLPEHIMQWNFATKEWHCPNAVNDLTPGGKFSWRMEAKDGSMGFDFSGTYDHIKLKSQIEFKLDDGRRVTIDFQKQNEKTKIIEVFEAEEENSIDLQKNGWQAILNNFKAYVESAIT